MENKLTLEHLSAYLPYGLKIRNILGKGSTWTLTQFNIEQFSDDDKLILRPLSDLTKEIEHNGWSFTFSEVYLSNSKIAKILGVEHSTFDNFLNDIDYLSIQLLLKYHFDIFRLIDKGLAVDINTLKGG